MIPNSVEWRSWKALDKATYLAQMIAPISLLVSSIFSYLSWTEAREARQVQERFFTAEKGSKVNVVSSRMTTVSDQSKAIVFDVKNLGDAAALDYCISIMINDLKQFAGTCGDSGPISHIAIERHSSFPYVLPVIDKVRAAINFIPKNCLL